jgi:ribosome maturation factor RimP
MAKKKITEIIEEISAEFLAQNGLELYNSEFVKEGRDWFLRVYIDKMQEAQEAAKAEIAAVSERAAEAAESGEAPLPAIYVSTDDCEKVSRFLSAELDRIDPIEQNYYLEVSSPGMDRALLRDKDFVRFAGEIVDVSLYKAVDGRKAYQGRLVGIEDGKIILTDEQDNRIEFPREQVAKTKLAVIF